MNNHCNSTQLSQTIKQLGQKIGFDQIGFTNYDLSTAAKPLATWLQQNYNGEMHYLGNNTDKRIHPELLFPAIKSIICCKIYYQPANNDITREHPLAAYAINRDYHKLMRKLLLRFAKQLATIIENFDYRVFCGSGPLLEKNLAAKAGLGWIGKNTLLLHPKAGSYCFLGEILCNIELPPDQPLPNYCGKCQKCLQACPTKALVAPYILDAKRCISYLTIEHKQPIPTELKHLCAGKVFGCDICQQVCPWNKFAKPGNALFQPCNHLQHATLAELANWNEQQFLEKTLSTPIRRINYAKWRENISKK